VDIIFANSGILVQTYHQNKNQHYIDSSTIMNPLMTDHVTLGPSTHHDDTYDDTGSCILPSTTPATTFSPVSTFTTATTTRAVLLLTE
jgi:hypothetical protein